MKFFQLLWLRSDVFDIRVEQVDLHHQSTTAVLKHNVLRSMFRFLDLGTFSVLHGAGAG